MIDEYVGRDVAWLEQVGLKISCLSLAVEAAKAREPKSVPVLMLAQEYYDWVTR